MHNFSLQVFVIFVVDFFKLLGGLLVLVFGDDDVRLGLASANLLHL